MENSALLYVFTSCLRIYENKNLVKHFFINPTDAHIYKITGMLKQLKFPQLQNFNCFNIPVIL